MTAQIGYIIALLVAGLLCFLLEIITPTFGILAVMGVGALIGAIYSAFTINAAWGLGTLTGVLVFVPIYLVYAVRLLPKMPISRRLFLKKAPTGTGQATPEAPEHARLVGQIGTAETDLRPSGAVRIGGKRYIAAAESGMIEKDEKVRVTKARGMDVIVRREGK